MDYFIWLEIGLFVLVKGLSGFFSGSEILMIETDDG
jgi:hypothetical protein